MSALLIFFLVASALLVALLYFLRPERNGPVADGTTPSTGSISTRPCNDRAFAALGELVFSEQDWNFIRGEKSAHLNRLFVEERRAMGMYWLHESAARLRAVRKNHLRESRASENLNLAAEGKLLFLFLYLSLLCHALLLLVRLTHPAAPRTLVTHFQSTANRLLVRAPAVLAPVNKEGHFHLSS
jgi:hypothetical protein